jgi:hypothetical protein
MVLGAQVRRYPPRPVSVLSESDKRLKQGPIDPRNALKGELTDSERRKLAKVPYARPSELIKQIGYRHEIYNALECIVKQPALKEHEIVQRALYLANPKATTTQKAAAMLTCSEDRLVSHGWPAAATAPQIAKRGKPAVDLWWESVAAEREEFRTAVLEVHAAYGKRRGVRAKYRRWIDEALKDIVVVPRLTWDGRRSTTELRIQTKSVRATCGYALMLLVDDRKPIQNQLRLCKLEECGRPFLGTVAYTGSRPTEYCSEDCRDINVRKQTAERVARLRKKRADEAEEPT